MTFTATPTFDYAVVANPDSRLSSDPQWDVDAECLYVDILCHCGHEDETEYLMFHMDYDDGLEHDGAWECCHCGQLATFDASWAGFSFSYQLHPALTTELKEAA